jgi:hypothetical protein
MRQSLEGLYKGAEQGLVRDTADRSLIENAENRAETRFNSGVQAAEHMQAATGGATRSQATRGSVLSQLAGRAAVNATTNNAADEQQKFNDAAVQGLGQARMQRLGREAQQSMFDEQMQQQRSLAQQSMDHSRTLHNETIASQNKNAKRAFWGQMAGTGLGMAAGLLL